MAICLSLVNGELPQTADPAVIGWGSDLREIVLPENGTYMLQVRGVIEETSGAYAITISEQQP